MCDGEGLNLEKHACLHGSSVDHLRVPLGKEMRSHRGFLRPVVVMKSSQGV